MKIIKNIISAQKLFKRLKQNGRTIGFVPTMGYLHEGHLSLARQAKKDNNKCVLSIFVNPLQFGPKEDLKKYPRNLKRDFALARQAKVDYIFYPDAAEMYPKNYQTFIEVEELKDVLCGKSRPGHFKGVATVVAKLLNIVQPQIVYLGQKDAQQAVIIKKMIKDLNMDIQLKIMPIVREKSGLAMSSRNTYLSAKELLDASILYKSLQKAKKLIRLHERNPTAIKKCIVDNIGGKAKVEYIEVVDANTLMSRSKIKGQILIALAAKVGKVRLIDNIVIKNYK